MLNRGVFGVELRGVLKLGGVELRGPLALPYAHLINYDAD